ncbi:DEAD/DEAH box helicase, partial [Legionella sp.]|uniref:DEAD/DEAH box helicase n=1 Tax=Legionella sp. TaxID=459 RepID=UPI0032202AB5
MISIPDSLAWAHPLVRDWFINKYNSPTEPQEQGWPSILAGLTTLISAPTGSGKTFAAFLICIDQLVRQSLMDLPDQTSVVYISPLKALTNDIQKNLLEPLEEIQRLAKERGLIMKEIQVAVRTGDTLAKDRQAMLKKPPHILVTTPESFYLLLTAEKSRAILKDIKTVIVDEIHALANNKRGSHLSLSLERLEAISLQKPVRIGLSATQKPLELVADFLAGTAGPRPVIVNIRHNRHLELKIETPEIELGPVATNEMWDQIYDRIAALAQQNRSTLVFANTRRLAERVAHHLSERLDKEKVAAHHGSLSRKLRLKAETQLKAGKLQVLVATASLELGIDIGTVDLVCQLGSPRSIAIALQRIGRAGHWRGAVSKGIFFVTTCDELLECAALVYAIRTGDLDRLLIPEEPLDILAQQMVACCATNDWSEEELFNLIKKSYPYRNLSRDTFTALLQMLSEGIAGSRGRYGAYLFRDQVNGIVKARRGSRLAAITSGGAIPDNSLFTVITESTGVVVGTLDEDFAIESNRGDIILLGNTSWQIKRIESAKGRVIVEDAHGAPPSVPFWLGEAPSRTDELSLQVSNLRKKIQEMLYRPEQSEVPINTQEIPHCVRDDNTPPITPNQARDLPTLDNTSPTKDLARKEIPHCVRDDNTTVILSKSEGPPDSWQQPHQGDPSLCSDHRHPEQKRRTSPLLARAPSRRSLTTFETTIPPSSRAKARDLPTLGNNLKESSHTTQDWLVTHCGLNDNGAQQIVNYIQTGRAILGTVPTQGTIIAERFFDESGGMQLIIHSPFGARINKAWGLALRKRFCRSFNFELQAAATDNGIAISLAEQHSFPLADVFHFLHPNTLRHVLIQAVLQSPIFTTRWRWDALRALAIVRFRGGRKVPPAILRMLADDLLAAVFPEAAACQDNLAGQDIELPDHPLINETLKDCLTEALDIEGLINVLNQIVEEKIQCIAIDTPTPSVFSHEILNANPYAFLDDAPLEERRARAVEMRRVLPESLLQKIGQLNPAAISEVQQQAWPDIRNADELHDVLQTLIALPTNICLKPIDGCSELLHLNDYRNAPLSWEVFFTELTTQGRAGKASVNQQLFWVATEKIRTFQCIYPEAILHCDLKLIEQAKLEREEALIEMLRGWLQYLGPTTKNELAELLCLDVNDVEKTLLRLESTGLILRGHFRATNQLEWCERRLLARIHGLTLGILRKEIEPVTAMQFMNWLLTWQHLAPGSQLRGEQGLLEVIKQLQGYEVPANAWEKCIFTKRIKDYDKDWLDHLCFTGVIGWGRISPH